MRPAHYLRLTAALLVVIIAGAAGWAWQQTRRRPPARWRPGASIHFYKEPAISLRQIRAQVVYAVPSDRAPDAAVNAWPAFVTTTLAEMVRFHTLQFRGLSALQYELVPEPFRLDNDHLWYDSSSTNRGNPHALEAVTRELERRRPLPSAPGEFPVRLIIYEGVGASGAEGAALLSRSFFTNEQYAPIRSALFYHEFGHTLGLPDQYDAASNRLFSNDLMGGGRFKPLPTDYLDPALLADMGLRN